MLRAGGLPPLPGEAERDMFLLELVFCEDLTCRKHRVKDIEEEGNEGTRRRKRENEETQVAELEELGDINIRLYLWCSGYLLVVS